MKRYNNLTRSSLILLMILIFTPLLGLSQKATINAERETITLDKEKAIDVAKIISNEEALRDQIEALKERLVYLGGQIDNFYDSAQVNISRYNELSRENGRIVSELDELEANITEIRKQANLRLYLTGEISANVLGYRGFDIGLALSSRKSLFMLKADPFTKKNVIISLGYGLKLF